MQSFLPSADFRQSAQSLDYKRLGKQRVEAKQMLDVLLFKKLYPSIPKAWENHPCTKMWKGFEHELAFYGAICCHEWVKRGYKDSLFPHFSEIFTYLMCLDEKKEPIPWLGNPKLHSSHRAALLHKDFDYYSQFNWSEEPKLDYFWPV